jgi:hypothetical protein
MYHVAALLLGLALAVAAPRAAAQQTRAERTANRETSSHADVLAFLDSLARAGAGIRTGLLASTAEGRAVPWVLAARPVVDGPAAAHRTGRPVVLVQANIHGGEVEGKEAALMLLRDLTVGPLQPLLDSLVLLVIPIYNADGNEDFQPATRSRPGQNGPATVGRRANGQGLDLNRDLVKQEAPETRGLLALVDRWDPDLFLDLHTTNGSYHGYVLTYAPGLNPNRTPAGEYVRDRLLPAVRERMRTAHGQEVYWYGNFRNQHPDSLALGWQTFEPHPRFATNWFGLRGRMSILSEAYSNADFGTRIGATYRFVLEVLRHAARERDTILALSRRADAHRPDSVTLRSALAPPREDQVVAELTEAAGEGTGPFARRRRTGRFVTVRMPVFDRFAPVLRAPVRTGHLLPPQHVHLVDLLRRQGVTVVRLTAPAAVTVEGFRVDSVSAGPTPFEGHRLVRLAGRWEPPTPRTIPAGWFLVPADQRLGALAAVFLEPESEDGFATWNLLDRDLRPGARFPVLRLLSSGPPGQLVQ